MNKYKWHIHHLGEFERTVLFSRLRMIIFWNHRFTLKNKKVTHLIMRYRCYTVDDICISYQSKYMSLNLLLWSSLIVCELLYRQVRVLYIIVCTCHFKLRPRMCILTAWHFSSVAWKIERGFAISREILLGRKWHLLIPDRSLKTCTDENMRLNTTRINTLPYYPHLYFAFIEYPKHINSRHASHINLPVT